MTATASVSRVLFVAFCGLLAVRSGSARGQNGAAPQAGLFTEQQVDHGRAVYAQSCAACHGVSLSGGSASPLIGSSFQVRWSHVDMKVDDLLYFVRTAMPPNAAQSLSLADHAAVVALILHGNGYAPGTTTLAVGSRGLDQKFPWAGRFRSSYGRGDELATPGGTEEFIAGAPDATPGMTGPDQAALNAASRSTDWLHYGHDYAGTRHSPLSQITADNASRLTPACIYQMSETGNFQTGPIVHNGVMYVTIRGTTLALDAATCKPKWKQTWQPRGNTVWERSRGIAIKDGYVVRGTPDGYLMAMNAQTGALVWARRVARADVGETFTMAPMIFEDLVLIGPAGSENNIQGWVGAFRLKDGSPVWRFNTVPQRGEPGFETWKSPAGIPMGGGAVWTSFSLDTETGDLHIPVTNPAPDLPVQLRQGQNLYTNSMVVLDVRTGRLRWYNQLVPNDSHDWDLTQASPIISATINGTTRRLVVTAGKDGFLRPIDRDTRQIVYATPVTTIKNADVPVTTQPSHACPGVLGGVEWSGPAYHPGTNMLFVPAVDWCSTFTAFEEPRYIPGKNYMGGTVTRDPAGESQGWLTAIDASTGAVKWKYRSARPMVAAVTTTAGNLLLTGELGGDFLAFDARTGREVYRFNTGGPIGGGVVTYSAQGRQHIAAASGSPSSFWVDAYPGAPTIVVFALPR